MKKFSIVAGAALAAAAILVGAQNSARAQDQMFGYGGRDFCYEGWQTSIEPDWETGTIWVVAYCPDDGTEFTSIYAVPRLPSFPTEPDPTPPPRKKKKEP